MFKFMTALYSTFAPVRMRELAKQVDASKSSRQVPVKAPPQSTQPAKLPTPSHLLPTAVGDNEIVTVAEGDIIPFDGKILEGVALVDESAQVGVSTPALLSDELGRNNVIGGTLIVEGSLKIQRV